MITTFLRAKHWHLFILGIALPFVLYMLLMFSMMLYGVNISLENEPNIAGVFEKMAGVFRFFPIILLLAMFIVLGWLWSIGKGLQQYIEPAFRSNTKWFTASIIFLFVYTVVLSVVMSTLMTSLLTSVSAFDGLEANLLPDHLISQLYVLAFIVPFHLVAFGCSIYNIFFAAKTLKTVELQQEVSFGDFIGEFLMFWFYPIGIWMIQPKVNQYVLEDEL